MKKNTLHIISHSHLDREWYMPFERHRYHLLELIDAIMERSENDPNFKSFHLDGQVIPVFDYLDVKEDERERLIKHIKDGKINIGPWYILQDAFLTSAEANVRNMQVGLYYCKKLGVEPVKIGYFPDTFGNMSQSAQILNNFDIKVAAFGRGLNEVGFNNEIISQKGINQSELIWKSPDGSEVVGLFFANWYCNACDIPLTNDDDIVEFFKGVIAKAKKYSKIDDLLAMNGCDHTPLRRNIGSIVKMLNERIPDTNIIHSNFKDYIKILLANKDRFSDRVVEGEICCQYTTGYNMLINTASTRVDLKKLNYQCQNALEKETEPIAALDYLYTGFHNDDELLYAWKRLMQNHPHDSICSCSVDEVNEEVKVRFKKSFQMASQIRDQAFDDLAERIINPTDMEAILVINKLPYTHKTFVHTTIAYSIKENVKAIKIVDKDMKLIPFRYVKRPYNFIFNLPKDKFREINASDIFDVEFLVDDLPPLGYKTYYVIPTDKAPKSLLKRNDISLENDYLKFSFNENGTYNITDKQTNKTLVNQGYFEYCPDFGDEYNYREDPEKLRILSTSFPAEISKITCDVVKDTVVIRQSMLVPGDSKNHKVSSLYKKIELETKITLYKNLRYPIFKTKILNKVKDFRLRVIFDHGLTDVRKVYSEGQFDLVEREVFPWSGWLNPSMPNRFDNYVLLKDKENGVILAAKGLHEYEVIRQSDKRELALTVLRAVGEMGDWGFFATPDSQMRGEFIAEYTYYPFKVSQMEEAIKSAYHYKARRPYGKQIPRNNGGEIANEAFVIDCPNGFTPMSTFKKAFYADGFILRFYNITTTNQTSQIKLNTNLFEKVYLSNMNEEIKEEIKFSSNGEFSLNFGPKKIITLYLKSHQKLRKLPGYLKGYRKV